MDSSELSYYNSLTPGSVVAVLPCNKS